MSVSTSYHVVHIIETLGPGGAERALYTTLKHLDARRFRNTVITVFADGTYWVGPINKLDVEVISLGCRGARDLLAGFLRLFQVLTKIQPNLLHTHLFHANLLGRVVGSLLRTPVVSSVHSPSYEPEVFNGMTTVTRFKLRVIRTLDGWTARHCCRRMVAVSQYVRESLRRHLGVPAGLIEVLYNPIDLTDLANSGPLNRGALEREIRLDQDCQILLNVGRVTYPKGLLFAVRALPAVLSQWPRAHLLLAGATNDHAYLEALQKEAERLGVKNHVHILGTRGDVGALLRACDVFVFPSVYEGHGIALAEAMAAGCACIASATGPLPEVMEHGVTGLLVPPCDPTALARSICSLLADPDLRSRLGRAAMRSALGRFPPQPAVDRLAQVYESLLAEKR